jgi:ABC-type Fe3+ transport system permease subunit
LSGARFLLTNIPLLLRALSTIDQLSYGVEHACAFIDAPHFGTATDVTVPLAIGAAFLALGSYHFTKLEADPSAQSGLLAA